jgi:DNA polymerase (family X)
MNRLVDHEPQQLPLENADVADRLDEVAELLESQGANPFRVRAYGAAAQTLRQLPQPCHHLLAEDGREGLMRLPGIGQSLARAIEQLVETGHFALLARLRGDSQSERILTTVAGIGTKTAALIHEELGIETLPELEAAAYDGRLADLPGMGPKKVRSVRESLAGRFRRRPRIPESRPRRSSDGPPVDELLSIDQEYRRKAEADQLPRIAPLRFNPTAQAWLPILHTHRDERHYTALYSNTARAHEMGTTHDWVVIYRDDTDGDGQWTVVTSHFGQLRGRRVVRGREHECVELYRK